MRVARGFKNFAGEHCATTALRQVFACHGIKLSEEMLLGLGEGIGFELKEEGASPVLGMRGAGILDFESNVCSRLGIQMKLISSKNKKNAEKDLLKVLAKDEAAVVYVDLAELPYVERGGFCHMGAHALAVAGVDLAEGNYMVADRDEPFHRVSLEELARARSAASAPRLRENALLRFTYPKTLSPIAVAIETAAGRVADQMLSVKARSAGVRGIGQFAETLISWPDELGIKGTREALLAAAVFIDESGNGGGGYRKMYGRFLGEASRMLKDPEVASLASAVTGLARKWSTLASKLKGTKVKEIPGKLGSIQKKVVEIAESEQSAWERQKTIFD